MAKKINLNSPEFGQRQLLNKEEVLKHLDEYSIFRYYIGEFIVNNIMKSPFRKDNKPSFGVFYSKTHNCLLYKDMATASTGDCFRLVSDIIHPSFTYYEALAQVVTDFGIQDKFILPRQGFALTNKTIGIQQSSYADYTTKVPKDLSIKARRYNLNDYRFWGSFDITRDMLRLYNVVPISHFTYGRYVFKADTYSYAYIERKDGLTTYKVYQPFSDKIKFFTDMNSSIHAGYTQLPERGKMLLITKSLKDVMSITSLTGYNAISVLSETVLMKESVMEEYKNRFNYVAVFFDNDKAGIKMSDEYCKLYKLPAVQVPRTFKNCTDFSDTVKEQGKETAINMLESEIYVNVFFPEMDQLPF